MILQLLHITSAVWEQEKNPTMKGGRGEEGSGHGGGGHQLTAKQSN